MPQTHQLEPYQAIKLADVSADGKQFHNNRDEAEDQFRALRKELIDWQTRLYAEHKQKLLIVLQAMDAGGKDGTIRNILKGVNPQGVRVSSFKGPTVHELARDFLWRIHQEVPRAGHIKLFNRSHYEDVLVVRVHNYVPESVWRPRYNHINQFEKLLHDSGTRILKFYLHISPDEQMERFKDRLREPSKNWKFSSDDLEKRKQWDSYMEAYEEMLERCSTPWAPWHIIPANQKWYRNLAITRTIVQTLKEMDPQYPKAEEGLDQIEL